jgi:hypothetical protein
MAECLAKIDNWESYEKLERLLCNEADRYELKEFIDEYAPIVEWVKFRPSVSLYIHYCFALLNYAHKHYVDEELWGDIRNYLQALEFSMLIDKANLIIFWDDYEWKYDFNYKNFSIDELIEFSNGWCGEVCVK